MNQQAIGVLDFQIMGIGCLEFHNPAFRRVVHNYLQRFAEQAFFFLSLSCLVSLVGLNLQTMQGKQASF